MDDGLDGRLRVGYRDRRWCGMPRVTCTGLRGRAAPGTSARCRSWSPPGRRRCSTVSPAGRTGAIRLQAWCSTPPATFMAPPCSAARPARPASQEGVVFKVDPLGQETVLHGFTGLSDGGESQSGVILDRRGNLYGTTYYGGAGDQGVVYEIEPSGQETVLYNFTNANGGGGNPIAGVIPAGSRVPESQAHKPEILVLLQAQSLSYVTRSRSRG
jgi:uncharacterized repeat protein (TIGR03803 family)